MRALLNVQETARLLHIHETNLRRLISKRKIPFIKLEGIGVKFDEEELESWIAKGKVKPEKDG